MKIPEIFIRQLFLQPQPALNDFTMLFEVTIGIAWRNCLIVFGPMPCNCLISSSLKLVSCWSCEIPIPASVPLRWLAEPAGISLSRWLAACLFWVIAPSFILPA